MAGVIYGLCSVTSLLCAWLLLQTYGRSRYNLLFWSGLFFVIQTMNNLLLIVDKLVVPYVDLSMWRFMTALVATVVLLYGLVWNSE